MRLNRSQSPLSSSVTGTRIGDLGWPPALQGCVANFDGHGWLPWLKGTGKSGANQRKPQRDVPWNPISANGAKSFILLLVDLANIRRLVIISMFSDDVLFGKLVLKGGNAISLVYRYGARGSLDVDFSIEGEFDDTDDAAKRIALALTDRFDAAGFVVFDCTFGPRPLAPDPDNPKWGGYRIKFKLIEREKHRQLKDDLEKIRRNATVIGPSQQRTFTIDISKWNFAKEKRKLT